MNSSQLEFGIGLVARQTRPCHLLLLQLLISSFSYSTRIGRPVVVWGLRAALSSAAAKYYRLLPSIIKYYRVLPAADALETDLKQPCHLLLLPAYALATSQTQGCISNKEGNTWGLNPFYPFLQNAQCLKFGG